MIKYNRNAFISNLTLGLFLTLALTLASCSKKEVAAATSDDGVLTAADFYGTWVTPCTFDTQSSKYKIATVVFSEDGFTTNKQVWNSDDTCSGSPDSNDPEITGTLVFGDPVEGMDNTVNFDITITSPFSLTIYSIVSKPTSTTYVGGTAAGAEDDGSTADKRHTALDTIIFTKQ